MKHIIRAGLMLAGYAGLTLTLVLALSACAKASSPKAHTAASRAASSASAFATSSAGVQVQKDLQDCATTTSVAAHPIKNLHAFKVCLEAKSANPAKFNTCFDKVVLSGLSPGVMTRLVDCMVAP